MNFALRRRRKLRSALRYAGALLLVSAALVAATAGPLFLGWWDTAIPAAIGSAIAALLLVTVLVNVPLEAIAYVAVYFDREGLPLPTNRFGRALYRDAARLDATAREAGLPPLSDFESADPLETHEVPAWHAPEAALPTVEYLLARGEWGYLEYLKDALQAARDRGARFYFMVQTWAGGTNARVEALRRGDLSVLERR